MFLLYWVRSLASFGKIYKYIYIYIKKKANFNHGAGGCRVGGEQHAPRQVTNYCQPFSLKLCFLGPVVASHTNISTWVGYIYMLIFIDEKCSKFCVYLCVCVGGGGEGEEYHSWLHFFCRQDKTGLSLWMLGLGVDRLEADMNGLLALLFHQVIIQRLNYMFLLISMFYFCIG